MIYQKFIPEGWKENETKYTKDDIEKAYEDKQTLQGMIESIDKEHNVHVNLGSNIKGVIPQSEAGIISRNNKYVQFKVKGMDEQTGDYILSRAEVKHDSLDWAISLKEGDTVKRNCKKYQAIWSVCGNWWWNKWTIICK